MLGGGHKFGDMPATETLRPAGHGKIDLAVRWAEKKPDGLYLQSRYGTLRLSPVSNSIIRITFAKGRPIADGRHSLITALEKDPMWMYKSSGSTVELLTDELCVQADKSSGAIRCMTRDRKLLFTEKDNISRQLESGADGRMKVWLYPEWTKGETIYAVNQTADGADKSGNNLLKLRGTARYISNGDKGNLPFLFSNKNYGLIFAAESSVVCCDIPAYGTYLYAESEVQMDYYFVVGRNREMVLDNYMMLLK